ncbi:MAG: hypothetical protein M3552_02015 [Planctomycetota bacterium]|nr:hypothetical protein [Planctomycetota bacterium]
MTDEFTIEGKPPFNADLSLKPGRPDPADYEGHPIGPPENWAVFAYFLEPGTSSIPGDARWRGEFNRHRPGRGPGGSPDRPQPPKVMERGREYYWGSLPVPTEPGTYDFVITVHPAAEPFSPQKPMQYVGRGTPIFRATAHVTKSDQSE